MNRQQICLSSHRCFSARHTTVVGQWLIQQWYPNLITTFWHCWLNREKYTSPLLQPLLLDPFHSFQSCDFFTLLLLPSLSFYFHPSSCCSLSLFLFISLGFICLWILMTHFLGKIIILLLDIWGGGGGNYKQQMLTFTSQNEQGKACGKKYLS